MSSLAVIFSCIALVTIVSAASINEGARHLGNVEAGSSLHRSATLPRSQRWKNNTVPYVMKGYDAGQEKMLKEIMDDMSLQTGNCIKFVPRTTQTDFVTIQISDGCGSSYRNLYLGPGCFTKPILHHELMHQIGFDHEQNRSDRDDYITIMWDNINEDGKLQYQKKKTDNLNIPYDYNSQTHYNTYDFAIDRNKPTMVAKNGAKLGNGDKGMTKLDVLRIRRFYECEAGGEAAPRPPTDTLLAAESLELGQRLISAKGTAQLIFQQNGTLIVVLVPENRTVFSVDRPGVKSAEMQDDGNFVLYSADHKGIWATNTQNWGATKLVLQDDGVFVLKDDSGTIIWASGRISGTTRGPPPTTTRRPSRRPSTGTCIAMVNLQDTCEMLAKGYGIYDVSRLKEMNPEVDCNSLKAGKYIVVREDQGCGTTCTKEKC